MKRICGSYAQKSLFTVDQKLNPGDKITFHSERKRVLKRTIK